MSQRDEAIVLAGGLGTRLRSEVSDVPKPMAPIAGRPFLEYLLSSLARQHVKKITLSVGYLHEKITTYFGSSWNGLALNYAIEETPLGTGGAIMLALKKVQSEAVYVLNGDTVMHEKLSRLSDQMDTHNTGMSMFVRRIENSGRYGICEVTDHKLTGFSAGTPGRPGLINAGAYLIRPELLSSQKIDPPFSFETEVLPHLVQANEVSTVTTSAPFIDIGVPDSFKLAQAFIPSLDL